MFLVKYLYFLHFWEVLSNTQDILSYIETVLSNRDDVLSLMEDILSYSIYSVNYDRTFDCLTETPILEDVHVRGRPSLFPKKGWLGLQLKDSVNPARQLFSVCSNCPIILVALRVAQGFRKILEIMQN